MLRLCIKGEAACQCKGGQIYKVMTLSLVEGDMEEKNARIFVESIKSIGDCQRDIAILGRHKVLVLGNKFLCSQASTSV